MDNYNNYQHVVARSFADVMLHKRNMKYSF